MEDVENTRMPEEMELSGKSYYLDVSLEEAENNIHACLRDAARNVIATGHYLKVSGIRSCTGKPDTRTSGIMPRIGSDSVNRRRAGT